MKIYCIKETQHELIQITAEYKILCENTARPERPGELASRLALQRCLEPGRWEMEIKEKASKECTVLRLFLVCLLDMYHFKRRDEMRKQQYDKYSLCVLSIVNPFADLRTYESPSVSESR